MGKSTKSGTPKLPGLIEEMNQILQARGDGTTEILIRGAGQ